MEWTKEKPKDMGYYWMRSVRCFGDKKARPVEVDIRNAVWFLGNEVEDSLAEHSDAEWQGPIVPDEWIKCEDQMPPSLGGIFLLFLPLNKIQCTGFYNSQSNQFDLGAERIDAAKVSQWRRLPPDPLK